MGTFLIVGSAVVMGVLVVLAAIAEFQERADSSADWIKFRSKGVVHDYPHNVVSIDTAHLVRAMKIAKAAAK